MHALLYDLPCTSASVAGSFRFEIRLADEGRVDVAVYSGETGNLVSGVVRTDTTSLYNVIHGWPLDARDGRSGVLRVNVMEGVVRMDYERGSDGLRFEATAASEEFARRVHSLGGPMVM